MIAGIGIDTALLSRFQKFSDNKRFVKRILTKNELEIFTSLKNDKKANFLAKRFSGKEACAKALGCGIGKEFSFQDIEILKNEFNAPFINILSQKLHESLLKFFISFSDEKINKEVMIYSIVITEKSI